MNSKHEMAELRRKLVIVGDGAGGKTSLLIRYSRGQFPEVRSLFFPASKEGHTLARKQAKGKVRSRNTILTHILGFELGIRSVSFDYIM